MSDPDPIPWSGTSPTPPAVAWVGSTIVDDAPLPPVDDVVWYDPTATYEAVLLTLRTTTADPDAAAIMSAMVAAAALIDQYLDRTEALPGPPPPAPVQQALEQLTVELYRRKDAPFNLLNATAPEDVPIDVRGASGTGAIQTVAPLIQPWKQRWGFA